MLEPDVTRRATMNQVSQSQWLIKRVSSEENMSTLDQENTHAGTQTGEY